jgi:hypothetical protein
MGAGYSASGNQTLTTGAESALSVGSNASTAQRNKIFELWIANEGVPADNLVIHTVQRCSALGTSTAVTPTKLDPADRAAQAAAGENHTVEPTYTASEELLEIPLNTRATYRWVAAPGGEIVTPATVGAGVGAKALHASATTNWRVGALWKE